MIDKKLKVLQLGKFYPILGGVEKVMYDLTLGLSERGEECDMLCAGLEGKSREIKLNDYAKLYCMHTWIKLCATTIAPSMIWKLRKICSKYNIIHVHHPDPMACLSLFLSGYKGKVVLHWHSDIEKQKWTLKMYHPLQSWLIKRADLIVGTTPVYISESPCLTDVHDKLRCLPIGIDPIKPDAKGVEKIRSKYHGKKIIFSLGRLVAYKGYRYLVDAAQYLDDDYVILIGGNGALREELQRQIENSGVEEKVKLLGRISDEDLPSYYGACDLFCLSSVQKTEAFAIVQLEAMSCGKPIVATNIPHSGVSWVNSHGHSGKNVTPCEGKELAEAIKNITQDTEQYRLFCEGARKRYQTLFTKEKNIEHLLTIYSELWKKEN